MHSSKRRLCRTIPMAAAAVVLLALPGSAQEESYLRVDDVLPGACTPDEVVVGQQVDCRFPLARPVTLDVLGGPYLAMSERERDDPTARAACFVEGGHLVCRGLRTIPPAGIDRIRVSVGWEGRTGVVAEVRTRDWPDVPAVVNAAGGGEPYATRHRPLELWVDVWSSDAVLIRVRDRETGELVATLPGTERFSSYESIQVDVGSLPPGRYRAQPCLDRGSGPEACEEVPGSAYFQVGSGELVEVIPGWNRVGADRINLVLVGSGFPGFDEFRAVAEALLGFDGPTLLDEEGRVTGPGAGVAMVQWGPFATEPIRSHRDRFNVWLLADLLGDPRALFWQGGEPGRGFGPDGSTLPDAQVTTVHLLPPGMWGGSEAGFPSFTGMGSGPPHRDGLWFAGAYLAASTWMPAAHAETFTHELGHALFDLRDEYTNLDRAVLHGYPNCAPDLETAEAWWGHLVGRVDPFLYEYFEVMDRLGQWTPGLNELVASYTVGYVPGGCYGPVGEDHAVRPTSESIMNAETPVFGAVNRARVEEILGLWSGRDVVRAASDVVIACSRDDADPWSVSCRGLLAPYVDPPEGGLGISVGERSGECRSSPAAGDEQVAITCGPVEAAGYERVEVEVMGGPGRLGRLDLPRVEVEPVRVPLGLGAPRTPSPSGEGGMPLVPVLVAAVLAALGVLTASLGARRRRLR